MGDIRTPLRYNLNMDNVKILTPTEALFGKTRRAVLVALFSNPGRKWHLRELARNAGVSPTMLGKEVASLCASGIAMDAADGNRRTIWADPSCSIFNELTGIAMKANHYTGREVVNSADGRGKPEYASGCHPEASPTYGADRKSRKMGLSAPYDWSSRNIPDDALIDKVLERHAFMDVAKVCFHYGIERVRNVFEERHARSPAAETLTRMLRNIERGLERVSLNEREQ